VTRSWAAPRVTAGRAPPQLRRGRVPAAHTAVVRADQHRITLRATRRVSKRPAAAGSSAREARTAAAAAAFRFGARAWRVRYRVRRRCSRRRWVARGAAATALSGETVAPVIELRLTRLSPRSPKTETLLCLRVTRGPPMRRLASAVTGLCFFTQALCRVGLARAGGAHLGCGGGPPRQRGAPLRHLVAGPGGVDGDGRRGVAKLLQQAARGCERRPRRQRTAHPVHAGERRRRRQGCHRGPCSRAARAGAAGRRTAHTAPPRRRRPAGLAPAALGSQTHRYRTAARARRCQPAQTGRAPG